MKFHYKITCGLALGLLCAANAAPAWAEDAGVKPSTAPAVEMPAQQAEQGFSSSYLAGQFARNNGDFAQSIEYLTKAHKQHPANDAITQQLLAMWVVSGDIGQALSLAQTIEKNKIDPIAALVVAIHAIKNGDYTNASEVLDNSFETSSGQLWLPLVSAWLDIGNKRFTRAMTLEEMPVTVGKAGGIVNYHLALINAQGGFSEAAALNFKNAIEKPETAPLRIAQSLLAFYDEHPKSKLLDELAAQLKTKAYIAENTTLESPVVTVSDGVAEVLYTMGSVMQAAGVAHDAIIYLQLANYLRPDFSLANMTLAEMLQEQKQFAKSTALFAAIPQTSQYFMKAQLRLALGKDQQGQTEEALAALKALATDYPTLTDPLVAKGDLLRVHKRFLEASTAYSEAIARIKQPKETDWPVFYARGACFERLGKWPEAEADLKQALALSPGQPDVLNYLGYSWITQGTNTAEALELLKQAFLARPNDAQIIDSYGWALYISGQYAEALPFIERAVELLSNDATVNDHLGDVYWKLGRKIEAKFQWERALTFKPEEAEVQKINAKLEQGLNDKAPAAVNKTAANIDAQPKPPTP